MSQPALSIDSLRVLIVDNYDSFTQNLATYLTEVSGRRPLVVPHDAQFSAEDLRSFDAIVISPGPGHPQDDAALGLSRTVLELFDGPILGVCLGHQAMVQLGGGNVDLAPEPVHGRTSWIEHDESGLFASIPSPYEVVRYHSLVAHEVPEPLTVTAHTADEQQLVMALEDCNRPRWGVQFHPESIGDGHGKQLVRNFLQLAADWLGQQELSESMYIREVIDLDSKSHSASLVDFFEECVSGDKFWLDSSAGEGFSVLGCASESVKEASISFDVAQSSEDFFDLLDSAWQSHRISPHAPVPVAGCPFAFGWVGYLGYELKGLTEGEITHQSAVPDAHLVYCDRAVFIDHANCQAIVAAVRGVDGQAWVTKTANQLRDTLAGPARERAATPLRIRGLSHDREEYHTMIEAAQDAIVHGNTYEVCLTNKVRMDPPEQPYSTYAQLREANPSPRAGMLDFGTVKLLSTSPECFLTLTENGVLTSRPIKGTRPRVGDTVLDEAARQDLALSEKDRAENLMIVDLVRHDISRVADDVRVEGLFDVEEYSTVFQMVSTVRGQLRENVTPIRAIQALFPAGSMTGAPKKSTLGYIDALEGEARGPYSGCFGYISRNGAVDMSMTIRTLVVTPTEASYGTGGAIIALSDKEEEFQETVTKARPVLQIAENPRQIEREIGRENESQPDA